MNIFAHSIEMEKNLKTKFINFQETYPSTPPVWFAESEETSVTNAVQVLSNTDGQNNHVLNQVNLHFCNEMLISQAW